ncbi:MAG: hypothetical protein J6K58_11465 [Lachnospiraceae bacterium]|nr:hypothetical protein [Lachnospiraceae bacterium]
MKRIISVILISVIMICCVGCESQGNMQDETGVNTSETPSIVFLVRTNIYDSVQGEYVSVKKFRLGFYDHDGNFWLSDDPDVLDMDNETLIDEYEAGRLTDRIQLSASCDADILAEQYAKMRDIYLNEQLELKIADSEEVNLESLTRSSSDLLCSTWYGFYVDENGDMQYQIIHQRKLEEEFDTDNDSVNEIYDWLQKALQDIGF